MLTETEFARLIVSWKNQMGEDIRGRMCVPIDNALRRGMYKNLIETLIKLHNYQEEDFEGKTYRMVMEASINPNSERKEGWKAAATADWNNALDDFFPKLLLVHSEEDKPNRVKSDRVKVLQDDTPVELKNPIDRSIFKGLPSVIDEVDEDFLKKLQEVGDE